MNTPTSVICPVTPQKPKGQNQKVKRPYTSFSLFQYSVFLLGFFAFGSSSSSPCSCKPAIFRTHSTAGRQDSRSRRHQQQHAPTQAATSPQPRSAAATSNLAGDAATATLLQNQDMNLLQNQYVNY